MADPFVKDDIEDLRKRTAARLETIKGKSQNNDEREAGKQRHFESRFRRVVEEERVAINVYVSKEIANALDEECGPVIPGRKRVCRKFSRAYIVELFLYQRLINPRAKCLPGDTRSKKYGTFA